MNPSAAAAPRRAHLATLSCVGLLLALSPGCVRDRVTGERHFSVVEWTPNEELELGRKNAPNVESLYEAIAPDAEANRILGELVREMVTHSVRETDFDFHFKILNSSVPNAFALPGGFVYITRGLLQLLESEGQFISVLGHELGHVEHQHSMYNESRGKIRGVLTSPLRLGVSLTQGLPGENVVGLAAGIAAAPLVLGGLRFNREQETEADSRGVFFAAEMGYDPLEGVKTFEMFERLEKESNASPMQTELSWFRSHPLNRDRVVHIEEAVREEYPQLASQPKEAFRDESPDFRATLERFRSRAPAYGLYDEAAALLAKPKPTKEDRATALAKLGEARSALPEEPLVEIALGEVAYAAEDSASAHSHFSAALALYDERTPGDSHWKPHFFLGALALGNGDGTEAVEQLEAARQRFPVQPAVIFFLGQAYELAVNQPAAQRAYRDVLELTPSDSPLHREARKRLRELGR